MLLPLESYTLAMLSWVLCLQPFIETENKLEALSENEEQPIIMLKMMMVVVVMVFACKKKKERNQNDN